MKICVVIPGYNESRTIAEVVQRIRRQGLDAVVVDDGSSDDTSGAGRGAGATVLRNPRNEGKGVSLIRGFRHCMVNGFDAVITMDGDGQHLPEDIPRFINAAGVSPASLFVGNRMRRADGMPFVRFLTNRMMSWVLSQIVRQEIPDTQCGFRLLKRPLLEQMALKTSRYETESEILMQASRLGFTIESVPVTTIYRGEKSQIKPLRDSLRFLRFIFHELWTTRP